MALSDPKSVVSLLDKDPHGHVVTHHFDDVECVLIYAGRNPLSSPVKGKAYEYESGKEIELEDAVFLHSKYQTPMATGMIARDKRKIPLSEKVMQLKEAIDRFSD